MELTPIKELFDVIYGVNLELVHLEQCKKANSDAINFISRTEKNNGISAFVLKLADVEPNPAHSISVAGGGSVLSSFYQKEPYYSGRDIYVLIPKKEMSELEMLFYAFCLTKNKYRYSYGRQANKTLKDILVPKEMPLDFTAIDYSSLNTLKVEKLVNKKSELKTNVWEWFDTSSIFRLEKCKCYSATDLLESGKDIYYIGAKKSHNGVMQKVEYVEELVSKGNCIVFIGDGHGSVGFATYQPIDFIGSSTLICGYHPKLNKYNSLFLVTVLDLERFKYSFGRKYGMKQLLKTKIKLPAKNGVPDFDFMENYIKSLPYSKSL